VGAGVVFARSFEAPQESMRSISSPPTSFAKNYRAARAAEMISTGIDSCGASNERAENDTSPPDHEHVQGNRRSQILVDL